MNVLTNGSRLPDELVNDSVTAGVSPCEIPMLSGDRAEHNYLTQSESFNRVTEALATIKLAGAHAVSVFVVTRRNRDHLHDMLRVSFALRVDGVMVNRFNPMGRELQNLGELLPTVEHLGEARRTANGAVGEFRLPISVSAPIPPCVSDLKAYNRLNFGFCAAGTDRAYYTFDPLGNVRMCNHSPTILGNILAGSFRRLSWGEAARTFKRDVPVGSADCARVAERRRNCKAAGGQACGGPWALEPFVAATKPSARYFVNGSEH